MQTPRLRLSTLHARVLRAPANTRQLERVARRAAPSWWVPRVRERVGQAARPPARTDTDQPRTAAAGGRNRAMRWSDETAWRASGPPAGRWADVRPESKKSDAVHRWSSDRHCGWPGRLLSGHQGAADALQLHPDVLLLKRRTEHDRVPYHLTASDAGSALLMGGTSHGSYTETRCLHRRRVQMRRSVASGGKSRRQITEANHAGK